MRSSTACVGAYWDDRFVVLGARLRAIYGNQVRIERCDESYLVELASGTTVRVTCSIEAVPGPVVRVFCVVLGEANVVDSLMEFALRENARLRLARLCVVGTALAVDYELPFAAACGPFLDAAVTAVARTGRALRTELETTRGVGDP